jgi:hypothetical protein
MGDKLLRLFQLKDDKKKSIFSYCQIIQRLIKFNKLHLLK